MRSRLSGFARDAGGASTVEFAFILSIFLVMMFGVTEFGRLLWTREALQETASTGARCMGVTATSCATSGAYSSTKTQTYIQGVANNWGVTLTNSNVALNNNTTCAGISSANGFSTVTITYTFQSVVPGVISALSGGSALSTTACFPNN